MATISKNDQNCESYQRNSHYPAENPFIDFEKHAGPEIEADQESGYAGPGEHQRFGGDQSGDRERDDPCDGPEDEENDKHIPEGHHLELPAQVPDDGRAADPEESAQ